MLQKDRLYRILFYELASLAMLVGIGAALVLTSQWHPTPETPEVVTLEKPIYDRDLLTPQEKEWAHESGVGSYWFDGMYWVDESLPSVYWR